ncbi:hypothetical protein ASPWEDRAFT_167865 [Aspergillus wentii DTO 134E9]|uniref:Uncharacterized protein n=1 Tax=Aspergillus wentii DTO 134E9 TaxID=1073089 RepID=A0A1L9S410_ASPWE|nr:uncharacterized protein ASPWEDRAFT_167865 [Aspergillus wentii DTO 134E9]KAI9930197.1 hypothetical protein MW887_012009 [Aspergillus wentii]OJJ41873.1 hypothetical protein ASPWEDRAFT_167865 [Aspergillus wentii DTO 134E9]
MTEAKDISMATEEVENPAPVKANPSNPASTPRKRGRKKASENDTTTNGEDNEGTPTKKGKTEKAKAGRGSKKGANNLGPIPTTLEAASILDKMILRMRDDENRGWADITSAWTAMTGTQIGSTTLRMRYTTMKTNFVSISGSDEARLIKFKKEIEDRFEQEKWHKISESIEADGGSKYPLAALQKKYKELSKNSNGAEPVSNNEE